MDRLSALIAHFRMRVEPALPEDGNLFAVSGRGGGPGWLVLCPAAGPARLLAEPEFSARVEWAGELNPLISALPARVSVDLAATPQIAAVLELILQEKEVHRCGAETVVSSLGQALMVRLLRHLIEVGTTEPGLLAGLSDARLARSIVAMHDHPGRPWTTHDLAREAGLSLSRFSELFSAEVGESPMSYLRRWRLTLARQDLSRGDRVDAVARRYAYDSPEGFTRAFRKTFGLAPISLRPQG